jgi:hypothetical protein
MGAALKYYTADKALMEGEGKPLGAYVAMCHLLCDSVGAYQHRSDRQETAMVNIWGSIFHLT